MYLLPFQVPGTRMGWTPPPYLALCRAGGEIMTDPVRYKECKLLRAGSPILHLII